MRVKSVRPQQRHGRSGVVEIRFFSHFVWTRFELKQENPDEVGDDVEKDKVRIPRNFSRPEVFVWICRTYCNSRSKLSQRRKKTVMMMLQTQASLSDRGMFLRLLCNFDNSLLVNLVGLYFVG